MKRGALLGVAVVLGACSTPPPVTRVEPAHHAPVDAGSVDAGLPSFDSLALRGPLELPAMREAARVEHTTELSPSIDTCYRALVAGTDAVRASFADPTGPRGEPGAVGLVPPRGPVCARKGETLRFVLEGAPARAILWQSP